MGAEKLSTGADVLLTESCEMQITAAAVAEELTSEVREIVNSEPDTSVKGRLRSAARHLGMPFEKVQNYWYGEIKCPPAHEDRTITAYYKSAQKLIKARREYEALRQSLLEDYPRLARLVPPPLRDTKLSNEAEAAARSELAKDRK
jgi:hypothetical protein